MTYQWQTSLPAFLDKWAVEWSGVGDWETHAARGPGERDYTPVFVCNHHTAGTDRYDPIRLVDQCNLYIDPDGHTWLMGLGYQYDTGLIDTVVLADIRAGRSPRKPTDHDSADRTNGNPWGIDIEVGHWGLGQPIPKVQRDALIRVNAAILDMKAGDGWTADVNLVDHKGVTRRKIDVNWTNPDTGLIDTIDQIRADTIRLLEDHVATRFADVPEDHLFYGDIEWMAENGITKPKPDPDTGVVNYGPDRPVTRGEMAAFLRRTVATFANDPE